MPSWAAFSTMVMSRLNRRADRASLVAGLKSEVRAIHDHFRQAELLLSSVQDSEITGSFWLLPSAPLDELHTVIYRGASGKMALLDPAVSAELAEYYGRASSLHRQVAIVEGITDIDLKAKYLVDAKKRFSELLQQGQSLADRIR